MRRIYVAAGDNQAYLGMNAATRNRLIELHQKSLAHFGYSTEALFWESRGLQKTRFKVLGEVGIVAGDSLLDVGCGFADLNSWLAGNHLQVAYTGIDLSPEILGKALEINPNLSLSQGEIFDFDWREQSFDWVVLSGTLNWKLDDGSYAHKVIQRMFKLCRLGVAFNMLDTRYINSEQLGDLVAFHPHEMLSYCQKITVNCELKTGYMDHDFTIYMRR